MKRCHMFAALMLACTAGASASTVEMRFLGTGVGRNTTISFAGTYGTQTMTVFGGSLRHEFRNGTGAAAGLQGQVTTFCTEVSQYVSGSWRTMSLVAPDQAPRPGTGMGSHKALALKKVWAAAGDAKFTNSHMAQALQVMIWEIVADFGTTTENGNQAQIGLASGGFRASGLSSTALNYFNGTLMSALSGNLFESDLRAVVSTGSQDQLVVIPLPSAAAAAAFGCCIVAAPRRRRRGL